LPPKKIRLFSMEFSSSMYHPSILPFHLENYDMIKKSNNSWKQFIQWLISYSYILSKSNFISCSNFSLYSFIKPVSWFSFPIIFTYISPPPRVKPISTFYTNFPSYIILRYNHPYAIPILLRMLYWTSVYPNSQPTFLFSLTYLFPTNPSNLILFRTLPPQKVPLQFNHLFTNTYRYFENKKIIEMIK